MIFKLVGSDRKEAVREINSAREFASLILEMFTGALDRQSMPVPASLPLPHFSNSLRFPVGAPARAQAKTTLQQLGQPQTVKTWVASPTEQDPKGKYVQSVIPPQLDPDTANCYIDVLNKVNADERLEKSQAATRF